MKHEFVHGIMHKTTYNEVLLKNSDPTLSYCRYFLNPQSFVKHSGNNLQ